MPVDGFDGRPRQGFDAGADAIFPEAMASLEFAAIRAAVDVPLLANMTEFGKSDLFTARQLADVGMNIVIWPVSLLRIAMGAAGQGLDELTDAGALTRLPPEMQHRADLYELIDYEGLQPLRHVDLQLHRRPLTIPRGERHMNSMSVSRPAPGGRVASARRAYRYPRRVSIRSFVATRPPEARRGAGVTGGRPAPRHPSVEDGLDEAVLDALGQSSPGVSNSRPAPLG